MSSKDDTEHLWQFVHEYILCPPTGICFKWSPAAPAYCKHEGNMPISPPFSIMTTHSNYWGE